MQYQDENIFTAYFNGERELGEIGNRYFINEAVFHILCAKHRNFGFHVEDVYCNLLGNNQSLKMESKNLQKNAELLHLAVKSPWDFLLNSFETVNFDVKIISTIGNYYYEMMDNAWPTNFWTAATNQKLTDVEIFVGTVKVMEAHRIILCARSPILNESLNNISNTKKSIVTFGVEFDVEVVKHFLNFLYTGSLKTCASAHQLSKLATIYQVKTLKNICQVLSANPPDAQKVTDYLLEL